MRCPNLFTTLLLVLSILSGSIAHAQVYPLIETGKHTARIWSLSVDSAERWVVTASNDKTARVWNLKTGQLEQILRPPVGDERDGMIYAVALSPDGRRVAAGGWFTGHGEIRIYLFDRATGRLIGSRGFNKTAVSMMFSRDGTRLALVFGAGGMRILDANDLTQELAADDDCNEEGERLDFDRMGRLITTCSDGTLRLYDAQGRRITQRKLDGGTKPFGVRFAPDGTRIAVGFYDIAKVTVVSAPDLTALYTVATPSSSQNGNLKSLNLQSVTWSQDGTRLYAGGRLIRNDRGVIVSWSKQGRGPPVLHDAATNTILDIAPLAHGRLLFADSDASWGILGPQGEEQQVVLPDLLNFGDEDDLRNFRVSRDGSRIEFGFNVWQGKQWTRSLARFDLNARILEIGVSGAADLTAPRTAGLPVTDWHDTNSPKLNGRPLPLPSFGGEGNETSFSLAIDHDLRGFVLSTDWYVRSFANTDVGSQAPQRWAQHTPDSALLVNQSDDGRFVVAAIGDGTIRWYDAATGHERLALFVNARDRRWVLFTPEGFYQASPGGDSLIGYQLNQGLDHEGQFIDSGQLSSVFFRPDLITARLAGDEAAITAAVAKVGDVRTVLGGELPPVVTLLSPAVAESDSGNYDLKVNITPSHPGARVGALQLTVNGAAVQSRELSPPGGGEVTQHIFLGPGMNLVSLRVARRDGKVVSNEVMAQVTVRPPQVKPVLRVLAVGVSQYDDEDFKTGVQFSAVDAIEFARQLKRGAGGMYRDVDERVLTSRTDTSLSHIEAELQGLVTRARPEDVVVIYLAGHGKAQDGQYHFIPADFIYDGPDAFNHEKTLSAARLESLLKSLGAGKRLLILDTCDSGAEAAERAGGAQKDALARLMRSTGRYILAATSPQGKALEVHGHGAYTAALLEGLGGKADRQHSGVIEVDALADYVSNRVPELTAGKQHPMRSAYGENFPIANHP